MASIGKLKEKVKLEGNGTVEENGKHENMAGHVKMEEYEPMFKLPEGWVNDPETRVSSDGPFWINKTAKKSHTKLKMGEISCLKTEPIAAMKTVPKHEVSSEVLPLRVDYGNGPRIHKQLAIEYGMVDKHCTDCGQVGQLTCFSPTFRKWALRRVTKEELNQTCSRCHELGHNCLNCDIPITSKRAQLPVSKARKLNHCSLCGETGHNKRSCFLAV